MSMRVGLVDGSVETYRLIPLIGKAGFLLSPAVTTVPHFEAMYQPNARELLRERKIRRINISIENASSERYITSVDVRFSRLKFGDYAKRPGRQRLPSRGAADVGNTRDTGVESRDS
jgi:hypothetical protein